MSSFSIDADLWDESYAGCAGLTGATADACKKAQPAAKKVAAQRNQNKLSAALNRRRTATQGLSKATGGKTRVQPKDVKNYREKVKKPAGKGMCWSKGLKTAVKCGSTGPWTRYATGDGKIKMCYSKGLKHYVECGSTGGGISNSSSPNNGKCFIKSTKSYGPCNVAGGAAAVVRTSPAGGKVPGSGGIVQTGGQLLAGEKPSGGDIVSNFLQDLKSGLDFLLTKIKAPGVGAPGGAGVGIPTLAPFDAAQKAGVEPPGGWSPAKISYAESFYSNIPDEDRITIS